MDKLSEIVAASFFTSACVAHAAVGVMLIWNADTKPTTLVGLSLLATASIYAFGAGYASAMCIANNNLRRYIACRD